MKERSLVKDFSVGFVLFVATLLVIAGLFVVGGGPSMFSEHSTYELLLPSASGLHTGSLVYLSGVRVGSVSEIRFPDDIESSEVIVNISVTRACTNRIRENSFSWLQNEGLLGDTAIHIKSGTAEVQALPRGGRIVSKPRSFLEGIAGDQLAQSTEDLFSTTISILKEIQAGKGTLGQLLKNPELYENLTKFTETIASTTKELEGVTHDFRSVLADIRGQRGTLGKLIFSEQYAGTFEKLLGDAGGLVASLRDISETLRAGKGSLGKLVTEPAFHDTALKALESLEQSAGRLNSIALRAEEQGSALGRLALDPEMGQSVKALVANLEKSAGSLESVLSAIETGEGSLGMLVHDPSIAASMRDILLGVRELGLVEGVVRNAERAGREAYLRDVSFAAREEAEIRRARALAKIRQEEARTGTEAEGGRRVPDAQPVPASAPEEGAGTRKPDPEGAAR